MTETPPADRPGRHVPLDDERDDPPAEILEILSGVSLAAGGANVVMQLARLPVGRGVAESRVDSGRVDRHPVKRLRTTTAYLVIATLGTRAERLQLRKEINRVHAEVRSRPGDAVAYDAFDPDLQLWVAACLYKGLEDVLEAVDGRPPDRRLVDEVLYPHGRRLGTTLQVPPKRWPPDRDAFEAYWRAGVAAIEMDDVTRRYLTEVVDLSFTVAPLGPLGAPLRPVLRPLGRFMTLGFLPVEFRDELGLEFSERQQRRHRQVFRTIGGLQKRLPGPMRRFPLNVVLWDTRRRMRRGRPVI